MLQVARLAPNLLREATERVDDFLRKQINPDGGFRDRAGRSDLYYTVFGLEGLIALRQDPPYQRYVPFWKASGTVKGWTWSTWLAWRAAGQPFLPAASLPQSAGAWPSGSMPSNPGRGIRTHPGQPHGNRLPRLSGSGSSPGPGVSLPDPTALGRSVQSLQLDGGGFSGRLGLSAPSTPNTAAALTLLRHLGTPALPGGSDWLLGQACPEGGFRAGEGTPLPDLLSTATALHALAGMQVSFEHLKEPTLDFLDTLWTSRGAFYGNWTDDTADCEYTWYALLALGHLSL